MLILEISPVELWDNIKQEFVTFEGARLELEHSLVSLAKWESKWCKPFLSKDDKTLEETIDYIRFMTLTPNVDPKIYSFLSDKNIDEVNQYMSLPMTAMSLPEEKSKNTSLGRLTAETIYYWMITLSIPQEYQTWHLNRLLALIKFCNFKNQPEKKKSKRELTEYYADLNRQRRKVMNSKG